MALYYFTKAFGVMLLAVTLWYIWGSPWVSQGTWRQRWSANIWTVVHATAGLGYGFIFLFFNLVEKS